MCNYIFDDCATLNLIGQIVRSLLQGTISLKQGRGAAFFALILVFIVFVKLIFATDL